MTYDLQHMQQPMYPHRRHGCTPCRPGPCLRCTPFCLGLEARWHRHCISVCDVWRRRVYNRGPCLCSRYILAIVFETHLDALFFSALPLCSCLSTLLRPLLSSYYLIIATVFLVTRPLRPHLVHPLFSLIVATTPSSSSINTMEVTDCLFRLDLAIPIPH